MSRDLIYRQDVVDAIADYIHNVDKVLGRGKLSASDCKNAAESVIEELPSAQPERAIKDCRNCKHGNYNDHWGTYFCYYSGDCNDWGKWEPSAEPDPEWRKKHYEMAYNQGYVDACKYYENLPERKKGKWIDYSSEGFVECPFCHSATNCDDNKDELHYCFSCGADMRGEQDETD